MNDGLLDLTQLGIGVSAAANTGQDCQAFVRASLLNQPARAFGNGEERGEKEEGGERAEAEHPAPGVRCGLIGAKELGAAPAHQVGQQNAGDDRELIACYEAATDAGRCDFGDVERGEHRGDADAHAAEEAGRHELPGALRDGGPDAADGEKDRR